MWEYNYNYYNTDEPYLQHYGVKGMKWGVRKVRSTVSNYRAKRKAKEEAYRNKLKNIKNNRKVSKDVRSRMQYRNQSLTGRIVGQGIGAVTGTVLSEIMSGNIEKYKYMNRQQLTSHFAKLAASTAVKTATNVALKDAMAKSASKRYNDDGTLKDGVKEGKYLSKERKMEMAISLASKAAPFMVSVGLSTMNDLNARKAEREATFNKWGGNILNESLDNFVYGSYEVK